MARRRCAERGGGGVKRERGVNGERERDRTRRETCERGMCWGHAYDCHVELVLEVYGLEVWRESMR